MKNGKRYATGWRHSQVTKHVTKNLQHPRVWVGCPLLSGFCHVHYQDNGRRAESDIT